MDIILGFIENLSAYQLAKHLLYTRKLYNIIEVKQFVQISKRRTIVVKLVCNVVVDVVLFIKNSRARFEPEKFCTT